MYSEKYVLQRWRCWFTVTATLTNPYIFCPVFLISWTENLGSLVLLCIFHAEHSVMMLLTYFMSSSRQGQLWKKKNGFGDKTLVSLLPPLDHILKSTKKLFFKKRKKKVRNRRSQMSDNCEKLKIFQPLLEKCTQQGKK